MRSASALLFFVCAVVPATACSSSSNPPPINGVNDVVKACQLRAPWMNASATACNTCIALATSPRCPCTDQDYAGKCSDQATVKNKEPTCEGVDPCIGKCDRADCACLDACYAGKPACRTAASAADGCVAEICADHCK